METRVTVVEREESIHWELSTKVVVLSRQHLLSHTGTDLGLEIEDGAETEISPLTTL